MAGRADRLCCGLPDLPAAHSLLRLVRDFVKGGPGCGGREEREDIPDPPYVHYPNLPRAVKKNR
jgi:hypothetical protein